MRQPCELFVVDRLLPTLRGEVARILHRQGMREADIALRLGVTQATVSHYVRDRRGEKALLHDLPRLPEFASLLADEIREGIEGRERAAMLCAACGALRSRGGPNRAELLDAVRVDLEDWEFAHGWRELAPDGWKGQPCELVADRVLPLLRERTAGFLRDRYEMSQKKIASHLNVSQPVVVRYLASRERGDAIAESFPELDERASDLANLLASGMLPPSSVASVCTLCAMAWTRGSGCQCHHVYPSLRPLARL